MRMRGLFSGAAAILAGAGGVLASKDVDVASSKVALPKLSDKEMAATMANVERELKQREKELEQLKQVHSKKKLSS